jgi:multidrug efflux pump subunit AcrA (membrane-fusion protein)
MDFGTITLNKRSEDSNKSNSFERYQPANEMANSQQQISQLQAQLNDLQTVMRQQNDMNANLSAAARAQALANANNADRTNASNNLADKVMEQFVKSPVKFFKEVNPRKPQLSFNGSNYSEWENAIDRTLQHALI